MCGIFGFFVAKKSNFNRSHTKKIVEQLFLLSQSRGKESAGVASRHLNGISVFKAPIIPKSFIRHKEFGEILSKSVSLKFEKESVQIIGHTRLVTDGHQDDNKNNQPVSVDGIVGIHNGIIVNASDLWEKHRDLKRHTLVDTEAMLAILRKRYISDKSLEKACSHTFGELKGSASIAVWIKEENKTILASNTGSLFVCLNRNAHSLFFTSELYITKTIYQKFKDLLGDCEIFQIKANRGIILNNETLEYTWFDLEQPIYLNNSDTKCRYSPLKSKVSERLIQFKEPELRRCSRCVLPETVPYIKFDEQGVCNFCNHFEKKEHYGAEALLKAVEPYRSKDGSPDCIIGLSGGRDSCYGLHYAKKVLGLNPIAFTYDWGMVTDLARRNQARMCGKLGIEHIIVSADINKKRDNIKKNIKAWLKKPDLGIIPLFMAGDKQYFQYAYQLKKQTGIKLIFWLANHRLENCVFKSGFAGVNLGKRRVWDVSIFEKAKIATYYATNFIKNPSYLNQSIFDTLVSFYWSYIKGHNFLFLYDYIEWIEDEIVSTLKNEYEWETDEGTSATWRIGDGTTAFYNYIYHKVAGVTEHDTFRSNQIREGMIKREEAMKLIAEENQYRYDSLDWYARSNGFDLDEALHVINNMPTHYSL